MKRLMLAALLAAASCAAVAAPRAAFGPYQFFGLAPAGTVVRASSMAPDGAPLAAGTVLTWAFATGECGEEVWPGKVPGQAVAEANVASAANDYIISTGGQGGVFTCASDAGMERFVARYMSPRLVGFDFDIEAGQSAAQIASLMQRVRHVQRKYPQLRYSFTVATHAASDGTNKSLNKTGETVLAALRRHGVQDFVLNLMVMDYGPASAKVCVVRGGRCDMGASAVQAARNVERKYKLPLAQIALTPMIGVNDVIENVYTVSDAQLNAEAVQRLGMAGLHFWSLDRDKPCSQPLTGADGNCSTMPDVPPAAYHRAMLPGGSAR
ncbi:glycosyl hydrolase [Pseudoduganella sp. OTU4001]|uniref:glycosyl hydrolase n=1 Tax=Pseudoduganella sp. OTU4001 TaxID=3043854 RepID=UPI00313D5E3F